MKNGSVSTTSQNEKEIPLTTNEENESGIVVATFTSSPKIFLLFYYRGNLQELKNLWSDQKLYGFRLQKTNPSVFKFSRRPYQLSF